MDTPHSSHVSILQIFNRYLEYGGEEGCVRRMAGVMGSAYRLQSFSTSTEEQLARPFGKWRMAGWMVKNPALLRTLKELHQKEGFTCWEIHNVFPALSVGTYELAKELGVPVVQYLHNYRFGCAAATHFREGKMCLDCSPGKMRAGVRHRCWRGSLPATLAMTRALEHFWKLDPARSIHAFIAISEDQKRHHVAMGLPEEKIHVVRHFLDAGEEPAHLPPAGGDVLFLGRLVPEKGVGLLLDAWSRVNAGGRVLRIVGDGPEMPMLKEKVSLLGLKNVKLEGFVPQEQHTALWKNTSAVVAPSVWKEPFGMVVLEAWRQARPVVATRLGSFPEMIRDGETGWLAEPTAEDLARALQAALDSPDQYERMGRQGRDDLQQNYNSQIWLERISHIYGTIP